MQNDELLGLLRAAVTEQPHRLVLCVLPPLYAPVDERYLAHRLGKNINLHNAVWDHLQPKGYDFFFFKQQVYNPEVRAGLLEAIQRVGESFTAGTVNMVTNIRFLYTCRDEGNRVFDLAALLRPYCDRGPVVIAIPGILAGGHITFIDAKDPFSTDGCLVLGSEQGPARGSIPEAWLKAPEAPDQGAPDAGRGGTTGGSR